MYFKHFTAVWRKTICRLAVLALFKQGIVEIPSPGKWRWASTRLGVKWEFFFLLFEKKETLFGDMLHTLIQDGADMAVSQRVEDGFAIPAVFDQLALL